jgi:hypothetical protein
MMALNDRLKLRSMVIGEKDDVVYMAINAFAIITAHCIPFRIIRVHPVRTLPFAYPAANAFVSIPHNLILRI